MGKSTHKTVESYIEAHGTWRAPLLALREMVLSTPLTETIKWGVPCYTLEGRNVVALVAFKKYCGLWFYDAETLADPDGVLMPAEGGKSESMKQWRFHAATDIKRPRVLAYLRHAIDAAQTPPPKNRRADRPTVLPHELMGALTEDPAAQKAFDTLTPGKQREYAAHIADAKRPATKSNRIAKILPLIVEGKGLNDRYK